MALSSEQSYGAAGGTLTPRAFQLAIVVMTLADLVFLAAFAAGVFETHRWFNEDGPAEDLQALVLLAAFGIAVRFALPQRDEGRIICFGLAAMFLASCVRELEFRGTGAPERFAWFFYGRGQNVTIVAIFAMFAACYIRRWRELASVVRAFIQPRTAIYLAAGIILILSGVAEQAEKRFGNPAEIIEEWLELNGYVLFLLATLFFPYRDRRALESTRQVARRAAAS